MRISTKSIYEAGVSQLTTLQAGLARTQMQLSTDRRLLTPSDDPVASARALEVTQSQSINTQLKTNRDNARNFLGLEENGLSAVHGLIGDVQSLVINAGNGTLRDGEREFLAVELEGRINDLMGLANTSDGAGGYLFSGFKSTTEPFSKTATGANYAGDTGQRQLQVGPTRFLATSDSGNTVFEGHMTGNGTFVAAADPGNFARNGQGIISSGTVIGAIPQPPDTYSITFAKTPSATNAGAFDTTYSVTDSSGAAVADANGNDLTDMPFVSGQAIEFNGMSLDIKGAPEQDDVFTTAPSTPESLFTTLHNLLNVLRAPGDGPAGQAALTNGLNAAHVTLDTAFDNVLAVRTDVGTRVKELDYLDDSGADRDIQYASALSDLQGLDFIAATSQFAQQQTTLQAAQKSFNGLANLSLFNYIS